nr:hypothetical protein [Maricaulis sp.]
MARRIITSGAAIGTGIALGVALGAALDNIALGIALGVAFGAAFSVSGGSSTDGDDENGRNTPISGKDDGGATPD